MLAGEKIQQMQDQTVGKVLVTIGGGWSALDLFTEWEPYIDIFLKCGNAALLAGGLYMMFHKVFLNREKG